MYSPQSSHTEKNSFLTSVYDLNGVLPEQRLVLAEVAKRYPFRASSYYLSLIDWNDPNDPLRQLIVPRVEELEHWGNLDPCNEASNTVAPGVQHKYTNTVLLLCSEICGGNCRYCFRKRLFMDKRQPGLDLPEAIRYIRAHPTVTDVLLTGGDPLTLSTSRLVEIMEALRSIPHVRVIRLGSKMPAFNPQRISGDSELLHALSRFSEPRRRVYLMTHFDHPRELTDEAVAALDACIRHGVICSNQCPLTHGINDNPNVLADLFAQLAYAGCSPYYVFQCRPTAGNKPFAIPMVKAWKVFRRALTKGPGLASRPRLIMSHARGKIEICGVFRKQIVMRFHRAQDAQDQGRLMCFRRDDDACWLDELEPAGPSEARPTCRCASVTESD